MGTTRDYSWIQTAHYNTAYLVTILLVLTLSTSSSRAASIRSVSCVCTTQVPVDTTPVIIAKEFLPPGVNTVLLQPTPVQQQKLTFTLRKKIKMADQQVKGDVGVAKEVVSKEVNKEVATDKQRQDATKDNPQDNIVFPKDDETTSEVPKRTMPVNNRIFISGPPNEGYGRDAKGNIVEVFE